MAVIKHDIQRELQERGIDRVRLETQLSPAWTTDWMTERGRKRLLEYGIAPPGSRGRSAPGGCWVRLGEGSTLQHSNTPPLRREGFEHEDEHSLPDEALPSSVGSSVSERSREHEAPGAEDETVPCPRCGSSDTRLVSRFGSTPCKAFYICNSCLEPFDYFKCH
jgi:ring-1,2-phenylacetyl-CoA epoxidase subunit PaaD